MDPIDLRARLAPHRSRKNTAPIDLTWSPSFAQLLIGHVTVGATQKLAQFTPAKWAGLLTLGTFELGIVDGPKPPFCLFDGRLGKRWGTDFQGFEAGLGGG